MSFVMNLLLIGKKVELLIQLFDIRPFLVKNFTLPHRARTSNFYLARLGITVPGNLISYWCLKAAICLKKLYRVIIIVPPP